MMSLRLTSFVILFAAALLGPFALFVIFALLHAFVFSGYDLLPVGVLVDARFGDTALNFPYVYTAVSVLILAAETMLRPYLRFYA